MENAFIIVAAFDLVPSCSLTSAISTDSNQSCRNTPVGLVIEPVGEPSFHFIHIAQQTALMNQHLFFSVNNVNAPALPLVLNTPCNTLLWSNPVD